jgi:uncharacterized repeat protein (TIGR02543 family)
MSDIWIKTSTSGTTRWKKATAISIKRASATWSAAKNIWIKNGTASWLRVWPLSGVFSTSDPFITTTASGSTPLYAVDGPIRIGTTYYGRNGGWDPNGWTISSYSYAWNYWDSATVGANDLLGTLATGTYSSPSNALTISSAANASAVDNKYLSFKITANASNSAYNGSADSESSYGRFKVVRRTPINISASLTGTPSVGQTLSWSSSWNTTEAYKPDAARSTIKWYKSTSNTDIYEGGSRVEITRGSGSYSLTLQSTDNIDGYYIIAEESVYNSGSDYDIGKDLTTKDQNRITKVTSSSVSVPYTFTMGNNLYVGTNGYISLDNGNSSDSIGSTTGRVIGILPADLQQSSASSLWYWSNSTQFIIRWEGYVYGDSSNLRQYEVVFDTAQNYVSVYPILVTSGSGNTQAFVKNGVTQTSYSAGLTTGNWRRVYLDGVTAPTVQTGPYVTKDKSVMIQVSSLTSGTLDVGYTTITTAANQYTTPTIGNFAISSFAKGGVSSSSQGATRSTTLQWGAATGATRYEIQYQGSNDNVNWTTVQTYAQSPYNYTTSDTRSWSTSGGDFSYYTFMRANIRASESTGTAVYVYSDNGSYVNASGTAPGQPTFGSITAGSTSASIPVTAGSQGTNYIYQEMEYQYRSSSGSFPGVWSTQSLSSGSGTISLSGLSASTTYYIKIRNRNYDELYSSENSTSFTTTSSVSISSVTYNGAGTFTVNVSGGGPYYQIYWNTNANAPSGTYYDAAGTSTSISESLSPTAGFSYYWWARSSTQNLGNVTSSGNATSGTYSDYVGPYIIRLVSYDYNGGSGTTSLQVVSDGSYTTLPTPSARTGYTFNGWYTAASGGTYVGTSGNSYYVSSTLTLYAQWTQNPITPTITMGSNTGVTATAGTINWTSTNQASFSANGTFAATGTTGTSISKSGLASSTTYTGTVTVTSSTGHTASANYSLTTSTAFTAPSSPAPALQFLRTTSTSRLDWYCDYPSISGNGSITGMQFEIRTTAGGGTLLASGTRAYPGAGTYPYSAAGTIWAFRMGTANGDIAYSASARYGRARVVMLGSDGNTYYGSWSGWL